MIVGKFSQGTTGLGSYYLKTNTRIRSSSSMDTTSASEVSSSSQPELLDMILAGTDDAYGGVTVDLTDQPLDPALFTSLLHASLFHWKLQGKKGVWIKFPIKHANLIEPAVKAGFHYHHAEPKYLMLVHWLPSTTNTMPANSSHRVGIGAFVMNEKNEVKEFRRHETSEQYHDHCKYRRSYDSTSDQSFSENLLLKAKHKTTMHPRMLELMYLMQDRPSQETRFPRDGTLTLMPDGPPYQTRLANNNNDTILGDPIVMPDGPSQEMGELEITSNGLEERINIPLSASSDDDDDGDGGSVLSEVQPRGTRLPNGINNAILGFTGQAMATIVTANSPHSSTVRLFAYVAGIGFYGSLFSALFLKRRPNIAKTLFKIGVSTSAFSVMIALSPYLPAQWYLNLAVPAVTCLIVALMVALSQLD